ncbi:MAG: amino acid ABC transporter ATP-binding protein [bacterium JZ-2024 1]
MIEVSGLYKYYGEHRALKGVTLSVARGEAVAVIGFSGSGKSTLFRCINGLETFQRGRIIVDGIELNPATGTTGEWRDSADLRAIRLKVGMVFQQFNLFPHMTVLENIVEAPIRVLKVKRDDAVESAVALLKKMGLETKMRRYPEELSGGEQQRVAIARALAMRPEALLFDEPTSSLDPELIGEVLDVIRNLIGEGLTTVIATHEMGFAREVAHRVCVMDSGEIVEIGHPDQIFREPRCERSRALLKRFLLSRETERS